MELSSDIQTIGARYSNRDRVMHITEEKQDDIQIYRLDGAMASNASGTFEKIVTEAILQGQRNMIFDFQNLEYLSSAGLKVILQTHKDLKRLKGKVVLCCMADYIKEIFEISGFDSLLPITRNQNEARRLFA